jgi:solute carrier family 25 (mitochondrial phosphate transporter), member 23/24/25/41
VTFTYPLDIVRTRLSIQSAGFAALGKHEGKLPGMWATMIKMYKTEGGFLGLYRGILPTVAGVAPYVGVSNSQVQAYIADFKQVGLNFMVYESIRSYFTSPGDRNPPWYRKLAAGAISGAVAQSCTYPL